MQDKPVELAYAECLKEAQQHYENFPTTTRLVAKQHRNATAAIYSFARRADDLADEGPSVPDQQRLDALKNMLQKLKEQVENGQQDDHTFIALADTIKCYNLPLMPFQKLIKAFSTDVVQKRFSSFDDLLYYCDHSANPVGELVLRLHSAYSEMSIQLSNQVCSALQLINFVQDIDEDFQIRDRIYIPQDEMAQFQITESALSNHENSEKLNNLVIFQLKRATQMLINGAPLVNRLTGRLRLVIQITILSGLRISEKLSIRQNVFQRPTLNKVDWLLILARLTYFRYYVSHVSIAAKSQGQ